jgi:hypothetical protein
VGNGKRSDRSLYNVRGRNGDSAASHLDTTKTNPENVLPNLN